jgi:hypothetical protein
MGIVPMKDRRDMQEEDQEHRQERGHKAKRTHTRIISLEEHMQRLFDECEIAHDNCRILEDALVYAIPETMALDPLIQV